MIVLDSPLLDCAQVQLRNLGLPIFGDRPDVNRLGQLHAGHQKGVLFFQDGGGHPRPPLGPFGPLLMGGPLRGDLAPNALSLGRAPTAPVLIVDDLKELDIPPTPSRVILLPLLRSVQ
jgi:hypothetical protein